MQISIQSPAKAEHKHLARINARCFKRATFHYKFSVWLLFRELNKQFYMPCCLYNWMCISQTSKWSECRGGGLSLHFTSAKLQTRVSVLIPRVGAEGGGGGWNPCAVSQSVLCNTRQIIHLSQRRECILQVSVIQVSILPADFTRHWHRRTSACSPPDCINTPGDTGDCIQFPQRHLLGEREKKKRKIN